WSAVFQASKEAIDIRALLQEIALKPRSIPWAAFSPLGLVLLLSLYSLVNLFRSNPPLGGFFIFQWLLSLAFQMLIPGSIILYMNSVQADLRTEIEIGEPDARWVGDLIEALNDPNR